MNFDEVIYLIGDDFEYGQPYLESFLVGTQRLLKIKTM